MLKLQDISFAYETAPVLKNISFSIQKGQHTALIGASGCGKSTLLKIIYGLLDPDQGSLSWNDKPILGPSYTLVPGQEYMKYVAQGFELHAYRTVAENIGFYLSNFEPELKRGRVNELLEIVEMEAFASVTVEKLSGGQKQRVALAKALAKRPEVLLLDEPFGNIDNFRRSSLRRNLFAYLSRNNITSITATHDQTDILSFTEEIIVLDNGKILAKEETKKLYQHPGNYKIASLFGEVNTIRVHLFDPEATTEAFSLIYPHEIFLDSSSIHQAVVKKAYYQGAYYLIEAVFDHRILFLQSAVPISKGEKVGFLLDRELLRSRIVKPF